MKRYSPVLMKEALRLMNYSAVARKAGITRATVSRAAKGRVIDTNSLGALADALSMPVDFFYEELDDDGNPVTYYRP